MLPNFLCVGAQKSGTTTLFDLLKEHPEIYLPSCKEVHFFDIEKNYKKGIIWYENTFFANWKGEKTIGEITPSYMYFDKVPERIRDMLGSDIKLIFMLRNPIDRAYSHYWMSFRRRYEKESFEKAIDLEPERLKKGEFEQFHFSYIDRGFYAKQIKNYLKFFPKENMLFIIFEDFIKRMDKIFKEICHFLNVDPEFTPSKLNIKSNPDSIPRFKIVQDLIYSQNNYIKNLGKLILPHKTVRNYIIKKIESWNLVPFTPPKMRELVREQLFKIFLSDIEELEKLINRDLSLWFKK